MSASVAQQKNISAGCSKRPFSKAAASEEARRTLRYVEPLSDARTPLADFFSILLESFGGVFHGGGAVLLARPLHVVTEDLKDGEHLAI